MVTGPLDNTLQLKKGFRLKDYLLLEAIGSGGEASIWSAWDRNTSQVVAIKFTSITEKELDMGNNNAQVQFFANLAHPHIATPLDRGIFNEQLYFVMAYYPFGSLHDVIVEKPLPINTVRQVMAQVASALSYIHSQNIVHRDLKPANLLIDAYLNIYLSDFGLARTISYTTQAFHTGHGTAVYSPPEQHTKSPISHHTDLYSMGIVLFHLLTGKLPFDDVALAIVQMDEGKRIPDPRTINPEIPEAVWPVLLRVTSPKPEERPASAKETFKLIDHALSKGGSYTDLGHLPYLAPDVRIRQDAIEFHRKATQDQGVFAAIKQMDLTQFAFIHSVFSTPDFEVSEQQHEFMLLGSLWNGFNHKTWWRKNFDNATKLRIIESILLSDNPDAVRRAIEHLQDHFLSSDKTAKNNINRLLVLSLPDDHIIDDEALQHTVTPSQDPLPQQSLANGLSHSAINRLISLSLTNTQLRSDVLSLLSNIVEPARNWRPFVFSQSLDQQLVGVLSDESVATYIIDVLARMKSITAVEAIWDGKHFIGEKRVYTILGSILQSTGNLPRSLPFSTRMRVWLTLIKEEIYNSRRQLTITLIATIIGTMLAFGLHTFVLIDLPGYLIGRRILNTLGAGFVFGPLVGIGIFLGRVITSQFRSMSSSLRVVGAMFVGTLIVSTGFIIYHRLYLTRPPTIGVSILFSSLLMITGIVSSARLKSKALRIPISILFILAGIVIGWILFLFTGITPVLYYQPDAALQTFFLMIIFSVFAGVGANITSLD